jgi:hypothetical protein
MLGTVQTTLSALEVLEHEPDGYHTPSARFERSRRVHVRTQHAQEETRSIDGFRRRRLREGQRGRHGKQRDTVLEHHNWRKKGEQRQEERSQVEERGEIQSHCFRESGDHRGCRVVVWVGEIKSSRPARFWVS